MDSYLAQGLDTLRSTLIHSYSLPILLHIYMEEELDWFVPCAHCCCASVDKKAVTQTRVTLPFVLPWPSEEGSAHLDIILCLSQTFHRYEKLACPTIPQQRWKCRALCIAWENLQLSCAEEMLSLCSRSLAIDNLSLWALLSTWILTVMDEMSSFLCEHHRGLKVTRLKSSRGKTWQDSEGVTIFVTKLWLSSRTAVDHFYFWP